MRIKNGKTKDEKNAYVVSICWRQNTTLPVVPTPSALSPPNPPNLLFFQHFDRPHLLHQPPIPIMSVVPRLRLTAVKGYFLQDEPATDPDTFNYVSDSP